jgi:hypothetical protein
VASLAHTALASLGGYVADPDGRFDRAVPDDEVHALINEVERPIGTHLCGRRLCDMMAAWETSRSPEARSTLGPGRSPTIQRPTACR